jgi:hypothetical protein
MIMLDDLRTSKNNSEQSQQPYPDAEDIYNSADSHEESGGNFLGMTAPQRFIIVMLLLFLVCVLGSFALILTEKVVLPIF